MSTVASSDADPQGTSATPQAPAQHDRAFFGHPRGLASLFGIEMWERFSFYGMQGLILYYMYYAAVDGGLEIDQSTATAVAGAYGGGVYLACVAGAFVSDRMLGAARTLLFSSIIVMAGHLLLAIVPGIPGLALGMVFIALGSGGVKTTSQVVLGGLYERDDPRRDGGFSIFYMGINIGAIGGPLLTTFAWQRGGFHWGFGIAAIGMFFGLAQFILSRKATIGEIGVEVPNPLPARQIAVIIGSTLATIALIVALVLLDVLKVGWLSHLMTVFAFIALVGLLFLMYRAPETTAVEKSRLLGFFPMTLSSIVFFALFDQMYIVLSIYADMRLDRDIFGWTMPPSLVQMINPIFVVIMAGVFSAMWTRLGSRQWSTVVKFAVSNLVMGVAMLCFVPFSGSGPNSTPLLALVGILFLFTVAELLLSTLGPALASKIAPHAAPTRTMAVWYLSLAVGVALAGSLGSFYDPNSAQAERIFFTSLAIASFISGAAMFAARGWILTKFQGIR